MRGDVQIRVSVPGLTMITKAQTGTWANMYDSEQTSKRLVWPTFISLSFALEHCNGFNHCFLHSTPYIMASYVPLLHHVDFAVISHENGLSILPTALMLGLAKGFVLTNGYEPKP